MPRRSTLEASPYQRVVRLAAGLHCPIRKRPFFFDDFKARFGRPRRTLTIGRKPNSNIHLTDNYVSSRHAIIERQRDGSALLIPDSPRNGLYVDGDLITVPVVLTVGMRLHLGRSRLIAVDEFGRFKYSAEDYDDYLVRGAEYYGSNSLAGAKIGRSHETIRKRYNEQKSCRGHRRGVSRRPKNGKRS